SGGTGRLDRFRGQPSAQLEKLCGHTHCPRRGGGQRCWRDVETAMPRYVAFLPGVSPMNASMPELKRCFQAAGFASVETVLSSGNVVFDARSTSEAAVEKKVAEAMERGVKACELKQSFPVIVRSQKSLQAMLDAEPHAAFRLPKNAKRVVTFLRK